MHDKHTLIEQLPLTEHSLKGALYNRFMDSEASTAGVALLDSYGHQYLSN